jgi:dihydropteroate synthase
VEFLRVHDVRANLRAAKMAAAVRDARAHFS